MLAISVRIQGLNVTPTLSKSSPKTLLTAVNNARQYFNQTPHDQMYHRKVHWETDYTFFVLSTYYNNDISANFMGIIRSLGEAVAGDEKLLHFTGNSGHILLVNTKPAQIGLWFY